MGTLSLAVPLVFSEKSSLMPAQGLRFSLPRLIFFTHTLHHNTTLTHTHPRHNLNRTVTNNPAMWLSKVVQQLKMGHNSASIRYTAEPKCLSANKGRH